MRRTLLVALLSVAFLGLATSASPAAAAGTLTTYSITVTNNLGQPETHVYDVYRPTGLVTPAAAVFVIHAAGGTRTNVESSSVGAISLADNNGIVTVFPDYATGYSSWGFPLTFNNPGNRSDVPFFLALRSHLVNAGLIRGTAVYVIGGSQGALMTVELMCDPASSAAFRGYGLVSGQIRIPAGLPAPVCPASNRNYAFYASAGTADTLVPYNGTTWSNGSVTLSQQAMLTYVGRHLGCSGSARYLSANGNLQHDVQTGCPAATGAKLLSVNGGTHIWGGLQGPPANYQVTSSTWAFLWQKTQGSG
jgi:poly(3-hydroxybutyrate) depolymerase